MTNQRPPRLATWVLRHFGLSPNNDAVLGDLVERYSEGRSEDSKNKRRFFSIRPEDPDTHMTAIQSVLRIARNEDGHALSTKPPLREQVYVYLQLFVPFLGYVTRLRIALR